MPYTKKRYTKQNKTTRKDHCEKYKGKTVEDFWHLLFFIDEMYIDLVLQKTGHIFRERGTRYDLNNI